MKGWVMTIAALAVLTTASAGDVTRHGALHFHFEDEFSTAERDLLRDWITETADSLAKLVGPFPFDVQVYFLRRQSEQPVPFARTLRGRDQGIRFYVDPDQPAEAFRRDWTAAHELSHLVLPFLGPEHAWFAEGFASYMQYEVMQATGVLTEAEAEARYRERLDRAALHYPYRDANFVAMAPRLRAKRKYPVMYWGGAVYFMRLHERLTAGGYDGLLPLLRDYLACCRRKRDDLDGLITTLDGLRPGEPAATTLRDFREEKGFPSYAGFESAVIPPPRPSTPGQWLPPGPRDAADHRQ